MQIFSLLIVTTTGEKKSIFIVVWICHQNVSCFVWQEHTHINTLARNESHWLAMAFSGKHVPGQTTASTNIDDNWHMARANLIVHVWNYHHYYLLRHVYIRFKARLQNNIIHRTYTSYPPPPLPGSSQQPDRSTQLYSPRYLFISYYLDKTYIYGW